MFERQLPSNRKLEEKDLRALIDAETRESRVLEFKGYYMLKPDKLKSDIGRLEFLKAVCAFANSHGGDLIMGLKEEPEGDKKGIAKELVSVELGDPDQCGLQIQQFIRSHVRPPLGGVTVDVVRLEKGGHAVVVRVPKSWCGPHFLMFDECRFYIRDDRGKRPMDYEEIREGFLEGETTAAQLRKFRSERCAAIIIGDIPYRLSHSACVVLHVLPFDMFARPRRMDARRLYEECRSVQVPGLPRGSTEYDLDGCRIANVCDENVTTWYAYVFLTGAIEVVDCRLVNGSNGAQRAIPHQVLEKAVACYLDVFLDKLSSLDVAGPYGIFLSLLNINGHYMDVSQHCPGLRHFTRDHIFVWELVLQGKPESAQKDLFRVFNSVWNACGMPQSVNYDQQGNWRPRG